MNEEIKKRIEQIKRGELPEGYKTTKSGVVPNDWGEVRLKDKFIRVTRKNTKNNTNVLTISAQKGLISQGDYFKKEIASEDKSGYYLIKNGDFAYNKSYSDGYPFGVVKKLKCYQLGILSPLYICFTATSRNGCADFYEHYFEAGMLNREIQSFAQEGARNHGLLNIAIDDFFNSAILCPSLPEQQKIAKILTTCDKLIALKKELIAEKEKLKKSCLSKMFPKQGSSVPEMRFPGFADAWEQRKLSEVLISLQNNTLSRADLSFEEGAALNVHYGDVLIKFGEYLDVKKEALPMIADTSIVAKYKASFLQNGDIIVADTAEDETVGKCSEIAGLTDEIAISGLHTMPYRPQFEFASGFLGYYMNSNSYHHQLLPLMQGIKVTSISKSAMQTTVICYPESVEEQAGISAFFRNLDHLITLHRRELVEMEKYKKALMQLLLTGIVRVS